VHQARTAIVGTHPINHLLRRRKRTWKVAKNSSSSGNEARLARISMSILLFGRRIPHSSQNYKVVLAEQSGLACSWAPEGRADLLSAALEARPVERGVGPDGVIIPYHGSTCASEAIYPHVEGTRPRKGSALRCIASVSACRADP
jgi:hypothetical protein